MIASTTNSTLATMSDCWRKWPKPRDDASPMSTLLPQHKIDRDQDPDGLCEAAFGIGPELRGAYLYGDYCSGKIWTATQNTAGAWIAKLLLDTNLNISSFGEDMNGELYVLDLGGSVFAFSEKTNPRRRAAAH